MNDAQMSQATRKSKWWPKEVWKTVKEKKTINPKDCDAV